MSLKIVLAELCEESSSSERVNSIVKTLLSFCSENTDIAYELLNNGAVKILTDLLFHRDLSDLLKKQISCILMLLPGETNREEENDDLDITMMTLTNLLFKSNVKVFLQCISGIRGLATLLSHNPMTSSSPVLSSSSSSSSPSQATIRFLSVSSCALLLERATTLLSSTTTDEEKRQILEEVAELASTGAMNKAVEFVVWQQTFPEGGGFGESESHECSNKSLRNLTGRFSNAFEAFVEKVKEISLSAKKNSRLWFPANGIYQSVQKNDFFPTRTSLQLSKKNDEAGTITAEDLPLEFLPNEATFVENSGSRLVWKKNGDSTFFVKPGLSKGIFKVVIEVSGHGGNISFGLAAPELMSILSSNFLGSQASGNCRVFGGCIQCGSANVVEGPAFYPSSGKVTIGLELDAYKHALFFFVDGKQLPHCVVKVPPSVHFAVGVYHEGCVVELKSLRKLSSPSINPRLAFLQHDWK